MARLFAYLMQSRDVEMSDEAMFNDISNTIRDAMFDAYKLNTSKVNLSKTALSLALKKLVK